ncbi:unnamed protein product [Psylliodes chrysocephalus]|uniref:nitric-oxide synthase (NADPH) n=1 Tax=Psylliodes chrysocephalus TaxID=3402493 RepID=A0A9P0GBV4_9CUCU|nr:unnamed protein product [Psylliodes chrysocephala]
MGLDTRTPVTLWKDKALVEANLAVIFSFQQKEVTIVDHHTASDSFMKHLENENRLRNGCPADWVWIVPPLSGSVLPVFHQEMALYYLKPSYEYQESAWKTHVWQKGRDSGKSKKPRRKFHFNQIARAVKFTSKLFGKALSRRIKATVLYATETGKSENYAKKLCELFGHAFNAQVYCMSDYDISSIEHEALLLVVTSTFGNGDPPENGEEFARNLYTMKMAENGISHPSSINMATSKSFIKVNSQSDIPSKSKKLDRLNSLRGSLLSEPLLDDSFGPLSNVACDTFCLDDDGTFLEATMSLQSESLTINNVRFIEATTVPLTAGLSKCHNKKATLLLAFKSNLPYKPGDHLGVFASNRQELVDGVIKRLKGVADPNAPLELQILQETHTSNGCGSIDSEVKVVREIDDSVVEDCKLDGSMVNSGIDGVVGERLSVACDTFCLDDDGTFLEATMSLQSESLTINNVRFIEATTVPLTAGLSKCHNKKPGDHLGVFASNRQELVDGVIKRLKGVADPNAPLELQILQETHTSNGVLKTWKPHERLPACSLKQLFSYYLDITTPPTPNLLQHFASIATDPEEKKQLNLLANDSAAYEDWRHWRFPHLLDVLEEFPSVTPCAPLLVGQLSILQPRFYSISSSPILHPKEVHLTVAVVVYKTKGFAPGFYLPNDTVTPVILVGPGTGIAPFRAFWQHRYAQLLKHKQKFGKMLLFFGCRTKDVDLYSEEKEEMKNKGVLDKVFLALSRERDIPKTYVQTLALQEGYEIFQLLVKEKGHFYVCGDCTMAEHVHQTLQNIIRKHGCMSESEVQSYMLSLRDENRYHEDIFGITLRTAEVHNRSRETARIRMASEP